MLAWILCIGGAFLMGGLYFYWTYKHVVMERSEEAVAASKRVSY